MVVAPAGLLYLILVCFAAVTSEAAKCNPSKCRPEDNCFCMSRQPPGNLSVEEMPQLVMLTFDDHVNAENMDFYRQLLAPGKRKNRANGCNMVTTFFVSTVYTDFSFVHELHSTGNEIALHSITHRYNYTYWKTLDAAGWEAELLGGRDILRDYALIPEEDMVGARAPFLEPGTGDSHVVMQEHGLLYDSSVTVNYMEELDKLRVYPYTLDHGLQTLCVITPCLEGTYKGLWTVPLNGYYRTVQDDPGSLVQSPCAMADSCDPQPLTQTETFGHLRSNFELYYHYNKAPSPIFIHEVWLHEPERARGFLAFIDWLLTKDDVFFVTVEEVVRFMKNPKPLKQYVQSKCSKATEFTRYAKLTLYGSSCNGFGFRRSDLDVCLTFDRSQDGKDINHKKMIKALAYKLRRYQELENVIPITGAKVPIVQFLHAPSGLEVNICLYNKLVHHNTRLLKTYSLIDIRVQELGYALKHLAKLYPEGAPKPEVMIDGWNTWFFDDIDHLEQVWSDFGQNKQSVGQLWLGMLRFYTREFSFKRLVVCIRQKAPLTRLEKEWNSRCVAIEVRVNSLPPDLAISITP
ncbi:chitin deacetylase 8-like [Haemaphysalis longicornis]